MVRGFFVLMVLLAAAPAFAQEPTGCTFKWSLDKERALLAKAAQVGSGSEAVQVSSPVAVSLQPLAAAKLPQAPSRTPKYSDSYAGFVQASAPASAGTYRITLSHAAWIDVIQGGHPLRTVGFTGAKGCDGVAKSVKFDLAAAPYVIELSGTSAHSVALVVTPD
jgi:hypothetical protein